MPFPTRLAIPLIAAATMGIAAPTPAFAQDAAIPPAPTPAPAPSRVQGPPDGLIAPPSATPRRQDVRPIFPQPAAPVGPPVTTPTNPPGNPQANPQANPTGPAANRQQDGRPAPTRNAVRTAPRNGPAPDQPVSSAPPASPTIAPDVAVSAPANSSDVPPSTAAAAPIAGGTPGKNLLRYAPWGLAVLLILGGIFWWRRRGQTHAADYVAPSEAAPSPAPARREEPTNAPTPPPAPPVVARPVHGGKRARIDVAFVPLHASTTLINFRLRYAIDIRNDGELDAAQLRVRIGLFAGNQTNAASIGHWFELDGQEIHHMLASLPAGDTIRVDGELAAPIGAIGTFRQANRHGAIPILAIDCRYGHAAGASPIDAVTAKAFVLGCENAEAPTAPDARLAPLPIDRGPSNFSPLGVRDTGISKRA